MTNNVSCTALFTYGLLKSNQNQEKKEFIYPRVVNKFVKSRTFSAKYRKIEANSEAAAVVLKTIIVTIYISVCNHVYMQRGTWPFWQDLQARPTAPLTPRDTEQLWTASIQWAFSSLKFNRFNERRHRSVLEANSACRTVISTTSKWINFCPTFITGCPLVSAWSINMSRISC